MHIHDKVMHDLICNTLRERNLGKVVGGQNEAFSYRIGAALHNIPHYLRETGSIPLEVCLEINALDPSAKEGEWGEWVRVALSTLGQDTRYPA
ncbi:hypothetical protein QTV49_001813 [Vibrio vulnificus]|nr:hypothetical protein [Vibrio vulnificus]